MVVHARRCRESPCCPARSIVRAPPGTVTDAAGPTSAMRPLANHDRLVGLGLGAGAVQQRTWVSATTCSCPPRRTFAPARRASRGAAPAALRVRNGERARAVTGESRTHVVDFRCSYSTVNAIIIPADRCSAMWQCSIHRPGLDGSSRISTVATRRHQHGVLPDQVLVGHAVHRQHQKPLAVQVDRVLHGVERSARWFTRSDPHRLATAKAPVDVHVLPAGGRVAQDPAHLPPGGGPVHHRHGRRSTPPARSRSSRAASAAG